MFNKVIELIQNTFIEDDIGQMIPNPNPVYKEVFTRVKSIGQQEYYLAGQTTLKPNLCFIIRQAEYSGETKLRHENKIYSIYRTYFTKNEMIELYCEYRTGDN